ncbi:MAG: flagellar basal body L-ring protein FlgH [Gammaproteobacteria bacterium]|nr:flagellar basal body L-ring protein FlgH [Gammaproteobacteria bacterium]
MYTLNKLWSAPLLRPLLLAGCAAAVTGLDACRTLPRPSESYAATLPEAVPVADAGNGAIYQSGHDVPLFENAVAHRVGDVLTITLEESTNASKSAITTTKKGTTLDTSAPTLLGVSPTVKGRNILNNSLSGASSFDGEGNSKQSNQLTGDISVTVAKRLANGNLLVRGQKWIAINQGREYVRIQGIVRPVDIRPDNTVPSTKVADATIAYGSQGALNDSNSKGWLARFFDSRWMPF